MVGFKHKLHNYYLSSEEGGAHECHSNGPHIEFKKPRHQNSLV